MFMIVDNIFNNVMVGKLVLIIVTIFSTCRAP